MAEPDGTMITLKTIIAFVRREALLCICCVFALVTMIFVPPDSAYFEYIDVKILCLLFCLMAVVLGFEQCGLFAVLSQRLLSGQKPFRTLTLLLVLLPFFTAMLVTNDVALITFVPFTILVLAQINRTDALAGIVVLQTVAANLGSMATPVGNPQNLFLYTAYALSAGSFFSVVLTPVIISLVALSFAALFVKGERISVTFSERAVLKQPRLLGVFVVLFVLCLLSVFHLLSYQLLTITVLLCLCFFSRNLLKKVDYSLLITFVCFFVFAGNMGRIPQVQQFFENLLNWNTLLCAVVASQFISNVPAAVLLSNFTSDWVGLLLGVNIGGLGTPIASLASLISLKYYIRSQNARPLYYLGLFSLANAVGIALLLGSEKFFGY